MPGLAAPTGRLLPIVGALAALVALCAGPLIAADRRPLTVDDLDSIEGVGDPQVSPDGAWVAFTREAILEKRDTTNVDLWMIPMAGGEPLRLAGSTSDEDTPRFSPDGRWLAFLSSRGKDGSDTDAAQVWLLDRRGGEARRLTDYEGDVSDLVWSSDGTRLALVVDDPEPEPERAQGVAVPTPAERDGQTRSSDDDEEVAETPPPIVIKRLQFKEDGAGYLGDRRTHVYVFDVATRKSVQVTSGPYDDAEPAWSPDGKLVAFTSNRTADPDANDDNDVFVVEASGGHAARRVTTSPGFDESPVFTADGQRVVYVEGGDPKDIWYGTNHLAVVPLAGGASRALTRELDRNVLSPRISADGAFVDFLLEDDGNQHLARVPLAGGAVERIVGGERDVEAFSLGPHGEVAVLESTPQRPYEISAVDAAAGGLRHLTTINDAFLAGIELGEVRRFQATSPDGTKINAFLTLPPGAAAPGKLPPHRLPTILRIHGGPVSQFSTEFELEWQLLAAHGYAVVGANPRGSSGRGRDFSRAIWADWGSKDGDDVLAAVDAAVAMGVADPDRLGVGGWSYGGILTNYLIARTGRFKAATTGASEVNYLADYGTDHYQKWWEAELGLPWEHVELWTRLSPFFQVAKINTPTLILGGSADVNVPLLNSEQLYQALRRLGRETELVIYPGETHSISTPSYQRDRYARYLAWYDAHLTASRPSTAPAKLARRAKGSGSPPRRD